jgi:hypothetical protein
MKKFSVKSKTKSQGEEEVKGFAIPRENYKFLIIGFAVIILGFILMSGGRADNPNEFNPEVFSFTRITLAPILVLVGFGIEMYGIMRKPKAE